MSISGFRSKWCWYRRTLPVVLLAMSGFGTAGTLPGNCRALVQERDNLWLIKLDNSAPFQVTHDGNQKFAIGGISPDGKMIAYVDEPTGDIVLTDLVGKVLSSTSLNAERDIIRLRWLSANLLQVAEHASPTSSEFHFVEVPAGGVTPVALDKLPGAFGTSCTPSPGYRRMACNWRGYIELDRGHAYSASNPFVSPTALQTLDVAVGSQATTTTVPAFKLEAFAVPGEEGIQLRITTPDGQSPAPYLKSGQTTSLAITSRASGVPRAVYGFTVTLKHPGPESRQARDNSGENADARAAVATVRIVKSVTGYYEIEGDLAWSPDGRRIAAVEKNDLGKRWLILLNSLASEGKGDDGNNRDEDHGNIEGREALPIKGPISRIDFTSDTHIRVEGATQIFEQDIPAHGKLPDGAKYTITSALPKQFSAGDIFLPIYGWACQ